MLGRADGRLDSYVEESRSRFESMLGQIVEIPTVSSDPKYAKEMIKGANLAAEYVRSFGGKADVVETQGNPVVVGRFITSPRNPTVTVYNHIDVQPAVEDGWNREPFVFENLDGQYMGRGTTDDKGPALAALFAAHHALETGCPVNINFLWELEEEIGSPNFEQFIVDHGSTLQTDSVVVSDTVWISRDVPAVPYGLRGLQAATLMLRTGEKDVHSGLTGGAARNPIGELAEVVSRCYDARTGEVKITGFYENIVDISEPEMQGFLSSGFTINEFQRAHGLLSLRSNVEKEVIERIWCQPTFEVHGIAGGYVGPGVKTVVPGSAQAKVSMRLVPRQKPEEVLATLREFIKGINPDIEVENHGSLEPFLGGYEGFHPEAAARAIEFAFGKKPVFIREGGSIGAVVSMQRNLAVPIVFIGLSLPEHGYHAPNECFDWGQAAGGIKAMVKYFNEIGTTKL